MLELLISPYPSLCLSLINTFILVNLRSMECISLLFYFAFPLEILQIHILVFKFSFLCSAIFY